MTDDDETLLPLMALDDDELEAVEREAAAALVDSPHFDRLLPHLALLFGSAAMLDKYADAERRR
jgi:hypothetical protein